MNSKKEIRVAPTVEGLAHTAPLDVGHISGGVSVGYDPAQPGVDETIATMHRVGEVAGEIYVAIRANIEPLARALRGIAVAIRRMFTPTLAGTPYMIVNKRGRNKLVDTRRLRK